MEVIIDRFEGDFAVCENKNREMINIERKLIPKDAREGDILVIRFKEEGESIK